MSQNPGSLTSFTSAQAWLQRVSSVAACHLMSQVSFYSIRIRIIRIIRIIRSNVAGSPYVTTNEVYCKKVQTESSELHDRSIYSPLKWSLSAAVMWNYRGILGMKWTALEGSAVCTGCHWIFGCSVSEWSEEWVCGGRGYLSRGSYTTVQGTYIFWSKWGADHPD